MTRYPAGLPSFQVHVVCTTLQGKVHDGHRWIEAPDVETATRQLFARLEGEGCTVEHLTVIGRLSP